MDINPHSAPAATTSSMASSWPAENTSPITMGTAQFNAAPLLNPFMGPGGEEAVGDEADIVVSLYEAAPLTAYLRQG